MKGFFCADDHGVPFAEFIADGLKTIETRRRDMLRDLVEKDDSRKLEPVAIIRTRHGKPPVIIGTVYIYGKYHLEESEMETIRHKTLLLRGSAYDCAKGGAKWCYGLCGAKRCSPYPLPAHAIRHGRSWAEWDEVESV